MTIGEALKGFRVHLTIGKGDTPQQEKVMRFVCEVFAAPDAVAPLGYADELGERVYGEWLVTARKRELSNATINGRVQALKRIGKWLRASKHLSHDPFEILVQLPAAKDRRRIRRALWPDQCKVLMVAAMRRPLDLVRRQHVRVGVSRSLMISKRRQGRVRALIYRTALRTGLRHDECKKIRICDVMFGVGKIRVSPEACKVSVEQFVQLDKDLARRLAAYIRTLGDVDDTEALFAYRGARKGKRIPTTLVPDTGTLYKDLAHAGIEKIDKTGRIVDFHALRKSFITHLRMANVEIDKAQRLARHSDIKLTLEVYSDYEKLAPQERDAAEKLLEMWKKR